MKNRKYIWIFLSVVLFCLFIWRVYVVNSRYEKTSLERYKMQDTVKCDNLEYTIVGMKIMDSDEDRGDKLLCLSMKIKNNTHEEQICDLTKCVLDFNHSGIFPNINAFSDMNEENVTLYMNFYPKAEAEVTIPYLILKYDMPEEKWEKLDKVKCGLVFQLYPVKKVVEINLSE